MLNSLLFEAADRTPEKVFIIDTSRQWSFLDAARAVGALAGTLRGLGVRRGDRVGVHLHKCAESTLAMHAVVWAGATAVPLDPAAPAARLAAVCEQMEIEVIVTHSPRAKGVGELVAMHQSGLRAIIGLDSVPGEQVRSISWQQACTGRSIDPIDVAADDAAYIITTSGSTGTPKGIIHTHESAMAYVDHTIEAYGVAPQDRVTDIAPSHFDISTFALWSAPKVGASILVVPEPYQRLPASLSQLIAEQRATIWYSVPFLLQQLAARGDLSSRDLTSLRWIKFGGELMAPETLDSLRLHAPNATFSNVYGPAETNQCTIINFDEIPNPEDGVLPIGAPISGADVRIVDPVSPIPSKDSEVDDGVLWVASPTLMRGYHGMDDVNAKVIIELDGRRWYNTGDRVTRDKSGELTFRGRVDNQVKVRGFRIELEAVESELERFEQIENAVVAVKRNDGADTLVAGIFLANGVDASTFRIDRLEQHAAASLAKWSTPSRYVILDTPVFTGSGKLDRNRLRVHLLSDDLANK